MDDEDLMPTMYCRNPRCRQRLEAGQLCPSCRWIWRVGLFLGGLLGGIGAGIFKSIVG